MTQLSETQRETLALLDLHQPISCRDLLAHDELHDDGHALGRTLGSLKIARMAVAEGEGAQKCWRVSVLGEQYLATGDVRPSSSSIGSSRGAVRPAGVSASKRAPVATELDADDAADQLSRRVDELRTMNGSAVPEADAGADDEVELVDVIPVPGEPLPIVYDLRDGEEVFVADALLADLAKPTAPMNIGQLVAFQHRLAKGLKQTHPVAASLLACGARALERAYQVE